MRNLPLVTIQIPSYNQQIYIKEALDSALAQTYDNLQVIVSDDNSPDYDIFEYLNEYRSNPRVLIYRNETNLGRVGNYRNILYNLVKGEWFVNLDGDDYFINDDFISTAIASIMLSEKNVVAFQANCITRKITEYNIIHEELGENMYVVDGKQYLPHFENNVGFTHASLLYNVSAAKKVNFYNINTLDIDYFSYLKILKEGYIVFWKDKVYNWREHDSQETNTIDFEKSLAKFEEYDDLVDNYAHLEDSVKNVMLKKTYFDLTLQLLIHFFDERISARRFWIIIRKTRLHYKYLKPSLSLIKNKILR